MHDPHRVRHMLLRQVLKIGMMVGDGSWEEEQQVEAPTPDGKAKVCISIKPATPGPVPQGAPPSSASANGDDRGRPAEVARAVLAYLRGHPESPHADIVAAMRELGYSPTAVGDNLRVLKRLGLVVQAAKGAPYSAADIAGG